MRRLRACGTTLWHFLRELSGEAALERHIERHLAGCKAHGADRREAVAAVLEAQYEGRQSCC